MPATIGALLRRRDLGLTLLTAETGPMIQAPIRWVATSELTDPTPFLRGGELLLTTGMRLPRGLHEAQAYVTRLVEVGVVGLGLGIGQNLAFRAVPPRLIRAAAEQALPLLVVDEPTPFIAIGEAVAQMQLADETAALAHALSAQQALTRAAVVHGRSGVVHQLATLIRGWVVVTDLSGEILAEAGVGEGGAADAGWRHELGRMREAHLGSVALAGPGNYVSIHALGDGRMTRGFLVTGRDHQPRSEHTITAVAAALLTATMGGIRQAGDRPGPENMPGWGEHRQATALLAAGSGMVEPLLAVRPRTREKLLTSLRCWLAHHGRYDPAAAELGIHRNTLRNRMATIAELLKVDLDDTTTRMRLWFALGSSPGGAG